MKTTWRELIAREMAKHGDSWDKVDSVVVEPTDYCPEPSLDAEFDDGHVWPPEGCAFTVWTWRRVYFPVCYDGAESVGSVSRNPDGRANKHVGGW